MNWMDLINLDLSEKDLIKMVSTENESIKQDI